MSDTFNDNSLLQAAHSRQACRVAYTLNNSQPVSCTIIGSQPLFYMDFETNVDDEETLFDDAELRVLEKEIASLKKEIDVFERFSGNFVRDDGRTRALLAADRDAVTKRTESKNEITISEIEAALGKSRMAAAYIDFAKTNNVSMAHSAQIEDAFYDRQRGTILIHPRFDLADQLLLAARELRRHWQHRHGALIHPLMFHPDSAVLVNRAQVADLTVSMIRVGWELQLSGIKEAWERLENSPMGDLCRAFAYEAFLDFRTLNNGQAAAAVFECWFMSERCRIEDKNLIRQMLADNQGYVFDEEQSGKILTPALISALGSMPYGKNYLSGHAQTIISDPVFNEVRDRSNANFLWFIKFERSFRETERELHNEFETAATGVRRGISRIQDSNNDRAKDAEIVELFPGQNHGAPQGAGDKSGKSGNILAPKPSAKRNKSKASGENVVYLRRWSGD
ncbi:MAG: DUF6782 family putative metallopeptidase [Alphaproteobacteria bacterium]